ncbi:universal stress protein [Naasia sp. SYSU D00057]|uniref:universal stress protein n=1 Tax=Naasia sp. SYSU D00057 TaxID=2817380 RepID=UPI001B30B115|nr:universal stress protein [Naasia sp. SYSU D00057]
MDAPARAAAQPGTEGAEASHPSITRRVVAALDGTDAGFSALRWASAALRPGRDVLRLLVVETAQVTRAQVAARLREEQDAPGPDAVWWVRYAAARSHSVGRAMVGHLRRTDLLVLGSDRPTRLGGLVDTSLPLYTAAVTRCPLVVVPREWHPSDRVVLLVGENDDTDEPLHFAAQESLRRGTPLTAVHAWQVAPGYPAGLAASSAGYASAAQDAQTVLSTRVERIRTLYPGLDVVEHLVEGPRLGALRPELITAGLAVLGRHGAGVFRDVVLGSLAHDLIGTMPCPLAIVPTGKDRE